ncbi:hypothetical protein BAS07_01510 [Elizabethkingia anophelis]|nr:hypothetical protein BBD30_02080 [Elizabethkingia anophelis]OPB61121.1 hypothetical protein BAS07_01510 [Elizabethkingia anophelis]
MNCKQHGKSVLFFLKRTKIDFIFQIAIGLMKDLNVYNDEKDEGDSLLFDAVALNSHKFI